MSKVMKKASNASKPSDNRPNPFAGMNSAPPSLGGNYILPGIHKLRVKECKLIDSQRSNALMFVASLETLESDNEEMAEGSERSWVVNFAHASALSNIRHFISAAAQCSFDEVTEELSSGVVHDDQPLEGVLIQCEAFNVKTRKGTDFTKCKWTSLQAEQDAA